jgi:membrane-associated phospholipid phosphatase
MTDPTAWGLDMIRAFQNLGAWLQAPMEFFTTLGREPVYLALLPLVFWCVNKALGKNLVILLILANFVNVLFKELFGRPRPFWLAPGVALSSEESFSMPSGHALNAMMLWGYLIARPPREIPERRRSLWRWLLLALIVLISLSRVYLGVHFPGDILAGWGIGLLVLGGYIWIQPRAARWLDRLSLATHVVLATVTALAILGIYSLAMAIPSSGEAMYGELFLMAQASTREYAGTLAGMTLGIWIGLAIESRYVRFSTAGSIGQRFLRYLIGMIGLVALYAGLKVVFPAEPQLLGLILRIVRYAAMTLWVAWGWPWLWIRMGLGKGLERDSQIS